MNQQPSSHGRLHNPLSILMIVGWGGLVFVTFMGIGIGGGYIDLSTLACAAWICVYLSILGFLGKSVNAVWGYSRSKMHSTELSSEHKDHLSFMREGASFVGRVILHFLGVPRGGFILMGLFREGVSLQRMIGGGLLLTFLFFFNMAIVFYTGYEVGRISKDVGSIVVLLGMPIGLFVTFAATLLAIAQRDGGETKPDEES